MPKKSIFDPYTDWILEHYKDYRNCPELVKALNDNFGLESNVANIKYWFNQRFGMTTVYGRYDFSEEEKEFIKKYYPDHGPEKTAEMINFVFNTNRTMYSVRDMANNKLGLRVSESFKKELSKSNHEKMMRAHIRESGSVRKEVRKNDNRVYYKMKAADGRWKMAGIVIWEEANGPIPDGYRIIYLDGDNSNYSFDNMELVTNKLGYQVTTNKCYQTGDPEITKSLIKYYELRNALGIDWVGWQRIQKKFKRSK